MATLYVAEFPQNATASLFNGLMPPTVEQTLAIGAQALSAAFQSTTGYIRVHADVICSIAIGAAPVAATTNARLAAGQTEYFYVKPGHKIAVITNT